MTTESEYRLMPWKNGLGVTREMAVFPSGANLERGDFLWRLSSADVGTSGPFSPFPGCDRLLFILSGDGMELSVNGKALLLDAPFQAASFRGEDAVSCTLRGGPVRDLNVITRRDAFSCAHRKVSLPPEGAVSIPSAGNAAAAVCLGGKLSAEAAGEKFFLVPHDLLLLDEYLPGERITARAGGTGADFLLISLFRQ